MNKLSIKNYIVIADWMLDLDLNTRELLTYAIIYGFSQGETGFYYGSLEYLSQWLGVCDRSNVIRYLKPLVEQGLVIKKDVTMKSNQKGCIYKTVLDKGPIIKNPDIDYIIIQPWMMQDLHLNGKDLLLYALIHGYSRKESGNVCKYKKDYYAKWLQCRKDNVDRQIKKAILNGLIKQENEGFVAVVPEGIELPQTDNTPSVDLTQIDNTFPQTDNTHSLKLTTNNLLLDNLQDNLNTINNNEIKNEIKSKEELSVVVNKYIDTSSLDSFSDEKEFFNFKQQLDFEMYVKYQKRTNLDLAVFMQKCSLDFYRKAFSLWLEKQQGTIQSAATLIFKTITNSQFVKKEGVLTSLSEQDCLVLISSCFDLFDEDKRPAIKKSNEAYMIGVLNNIVSDKE